MYRRLAIEKRQTGGYCIIWSSYTQSPVRDFEGYLRFLVALDEDDIQLVLQHNTSYFTKKEVSPAN